MGVLYATVERVKLDGDIRGADLNPQIARALESASRSIDGVSPGGGRLGYRFYPEIATRYFSQLSTRDVTSLTLGRYTLAGTPTSVTNGGTALTAGVDYVLLPQEGPPYNELRIITSAVWSSAFRGVAIVGDRYRHDHPRRQRAHDRDRQRSFDQRSDARHAVDGVQ
jgi:hypothetical protein